MYSWWSKRHQQKFSGQSRLEQVRIAQAISFWLPVLCVSMFPMACPPFFFLDVPKSRQYRGVLFFHLQYMTQPFPSSFDLCNNVLNVLEYQLHINKNMNSFNMWRIPDSVIACIALWDVLVPLGLPGHLSSGQLLHRMYVPKPERQLHKKKISLIHKYSASYSNRGKTHCCSRYVMIVAVKLPNTLVSLW